MRLRPALGTAGVLLGLFGVFRLVTEVPTADLVVLALWLVGAVVVHDGVLSPAVVAVGWVIARVTPPRARAFVQAAVITGALVTVIAIPLIDREGSQPRSKAILLQDYGGHLTVLLAVIAALGLLGYAVRVARDRGNAGPGAVDQGGGEADDDRD